MSQATISIILVVLLDCAVLAGLVYLGILLARALKTYVASRQVRQEKAETIRCLGDVIKRHCTACKMTQEFVAEAIGVSRQAVSKWESGVSDPSTSNRIALARLFQVDPETLLQEAGQ